MKPAVIFSLFLLLIFAGSWRTVTNMPQRKLTLVLHHVIGTEPLVLGNDYKNVLGETITVEKFKYYLSNFSITDNQGIITRLPAQYFLVDEADSSSKTITLIVPDIPVAGIHFLLGVDSIKNVSGIQTGALDPLKGMFWTWNSGYIMAKLEGSSDASKLAGHFFAYHIGGFRTPANTTRMIDLDLPQNNGLKEIHITADINQWFKNRSEIRTADIPVCETPGAIAMKIADNYSGMFSINPSR